MFAGREGGGGLTAAPINGRMGTTLAISKSNQRPGDERETMGRRMGGGDGTDVRHGQMLAAALYLPVSSSVFQCSVQWP